MYKHQYKIFVYGTIEREWWRLSCSICIWINSERSEIIKKCLFVLLICFVLLFDGFFCETFFVLIREFINYWSGELEGVREILKARKLTFCVETFSGLQGWECLASSNFPKSFFNHAQMSALKIVKIIEMLFVSLNHSPLHFLSPFFNPN